MPYKFHKHQKRIIEPDLIYFVTFVTQNRYPYFKNYILCNLFIEELKLCKELKSFELYAFCILYDHIHLLFKPNDNYHLIKLVKSLKENFSRDANRILGYGFMGNDTSTCRFPLITFIKKHQYSHTTIPRFKWLKSYFDHVIRNNRDFEYHFDYTVWNFQKHRGHNATIKPSIPGDDNDHCRLPRYPLPHCHLPKNQFTDDYQYTSLNYPDLIDDVYF